MEDMTFIRALLRFATWNALTGLITLFLGMLIPRRVNYNTFPFKSFGFEDGGKAYQKLGITKWKTKIPDASRVLHTMTRKAISDDFNSVSIERLIQETCIAEATHWLLIGLSWLTYIFVPAACNTLFVTAYALGNIPFIMTQRYNRPRLVIALEKCRRREMR